LWNKLLGVAVKSFAEQKTLKRLLGAVIWRIIALYNLSEETSTPIQKGFGFACLDWLCFFLSLCGRNRFTAATRQVENEILFCFLFVFLWLFGCGILVFFSTRINERSRKQRTAKCKRALAWPNQKPKSSLTCQPPNKPMPMSNFAHQKA
jgi:hypothetical protein